MREEGTEVFARFCNHCGQPQVASARFCGDCGQPMVVVSAVEQTSINASPVHEEQPIGKRWSAASLMVVYVVVMGLLYLAFKFEWPSFGVIVYWVSSVFLTHVLYRDVVAFHPMYNTLGNMVMQKLLTLFLWPIRVPIVLFQVAFNDAL